MLRVLDAREPKGFFTDFNPQDFDGQFEWNPRATRPSLGMQAPPILPSDQATLELEQLEAIRRVPVGAAALSGVAVLLLLIAWLLIYLLIYLPRGMIG